MHICAKTALFVVGVNEATFIKKNKESWSVYETELQTKAEQDPDDLVYRYVQILDDLSYARTYFPQSATVPYLNTLAMQSHGQIHVNQKQRLSQLLSFWASGLPLLFYKNRRYLLYSFTSFMLAYFIGVISALHDDTFVRLILGDGYVNMTIENMRQGKPMGVYASEGEMEMFLSIASNNIYVSFIAFLFGVFTTLGPLSLLLQNGIMLGAFQTFFVQHGYTDTFIHTVFLHGVIELSSIIIAGGAGWMMGNAILFPGTYTRFESFKRKAGEGARMAFGLVPLFIVAAFIESFITRLPLHPIAAYGIVLGSLAFMVWYVIIWPYRVHKNSIYARIK